MEKKSLNKVLKYGVPAALLAGMASYFLAEKAHDGGLSEGRPRIMIQESEVGPLYLPSKVSIRVSRAGRETRYAAISKLRIRPGAGAAYKEFAPSVGLLGRPLAMVAIRPIEGRLRPEVAELDMPDSPGDYVQQLLTFARQEKWRGLGAELARLGLDPNAVTEPAGESAPAARPVRFEYAGVLEPVPDLELLEEQLKRLRYPQSGSLLIRVPRLIEDWRRCYDATFDVLLVGDRPLIGLCVGQMSVGELLVIPAFLRRYAGRYRAVIANYDLTNENFVLTSNSPELVKAARRVALVLELIHRADPSAEVCLAVSYNPRPSWRDWAKAQDPRRYSSVVLSGSSASHACVHAKAAKVVFEQVRKELDDKPLGLIGLRHPRLDELLSGRGGRPVRFHHNLMTALRAIGFAFVQIEESSR